MNISFRAYNGTDDCNTMFEIRKESAVVDRVDPISTCENIPTLESIANSVESDDQADRLLFITIDDVVVGYAQMSWWLEADGTWVYLHNDWVLPKYRKPKILNMFLDRIQQHLTDLAKRHKHLATAVFATNASETEAQRSNLLASRGYKLVWSMIEMEFVDFDGLEVTSSPDGIAIRTPVEKEYRSIWQANNQVYEGTWGSVPVDEEDFNSFVSRSLQTPDLCTVAIDDDRLAGFVLSFIKDGVGIVDEVTTVRAYQKQGIGRAVLTRNLTQLHEHGVKVVRLHTDAANGAGGRSLYEKIGFRPIKLYGRYRRSMLG